MYCIIRFYRDTCERETVAKHLTLEEAQAHCKDAETSSRTCEEPENVARTIERGPWFDGYEEE